jgi:hypothetical protein
VRTTSSGRTASYSYQRPSWRRPLIALGVVLVIVGLIAVGAFVAYNAYQRYVQRVLTIPGCQAGTGANAIGLDFGETADAATVAGVAARERLPREALIVAYATAWQESKLENLHYGDRDSVGIFQQRPSEGWGTTRQIEDPVYATERFFEALTAVPQYLSLPIDVAAQDVQHSADGSAYAQWADMGTALATAFTGADPHSVWCSYSDPPGATSLAAAGRAMTAAFGLNAHRKGKGQTMIVSVGAVAQGWAVTAWLVSHGAEYGIDSVRYGGYRWLGFSGPSRWRAERGTPPWPGGTASVEFG